MELPIDAHDALVLGPEVLAGPTGSGVLDGRTFVAKDLFDVAGTRTGAGNPDIRAAAEPARRHAVAVDRLLAAGATCIGRARTVETAYALSAAASHEPVPVHPLAPGRDPGGSSSGSAVAVAAGLCDLALGTDTAGSVRVPASYCGLVGVRPTHGRIPPDGVFPLAPRFDTVGWLTRSGSLAREVGRVLLDGPGTVARPTRLLVAVDLFDVVAPEVRAALEVAVARVAAVAGLSPVPALLWGDDEPGTWAGAFRTLQRADAWAANRSWIERLRPRFGPEVAPRWEEASATTAEQAAEAEPVRLRFAAHVAALTAGGAVVLAPSANGPAPELGLPPADAAAARASLLPVSVVAPLAGVPQVSVPLALVDGLPVGLGLLGAAGADEVLLELAAQLVP